MLAIEQYLKDYPQAKDTVEGVRFWCDANSVCASRSVVEEALRGLVELGIVKQRIAGRSGRVIYSRIPEVESEAPDSQRCWTKNGRSIADDGKGDAL